MEAYVNGVSTRKVDHLVSELGIHGCQRTRSRASAASSTARSQAFRTRPLEGAYPYLWLDAKHLKVRDRGHVHSKALMVAFAVHESGRREVIGIEIAEAETEAGWAAFLRELVARGLEGVRLCVSDDHLGLKAAIAKVLGCPWQRCTVHFIRNMHGHCKKGQRNMVSAALREVFNAEDLADAKERSASVHRAPRPDGAEGGGICSKPPRRTCWPSTASRPRTGRSCAPPTTSSASTRRSPVALTSSASSPTTARRSAWSGRS